MASAPWTSSAEQIASIVTAYDRYVSEALHAVPTYDTLVFRKPMNPTNPGPSMVFEIHQNITPTLTALDEITDPAGFQVPNNTQVTVTPAYYGNFTRITKQALQDSFEIGLDTSIGDRIARMAADHRNALIETVLASGTNTIAVIGSTATAGSTAATGTLNADAIRYAATRLKMANVATFDGINYVAFTPINVANDLRANTDAAGWRTPSNYGGISGEGIIRGEIGTFEGVRFVETNVNSKTGSGTSTIYKVYVVGAEAVCGFEPIPTTVVRSTKFVDHLDRFEELGYKFRSGWQLFRPEALWVIYVKSSVNV